MRRFSNVSRLLKDYGLVALVVAGVFVLYDVLAPRAPDLPDIAPTFTLPLTTGKVLDSRSLQGSVAVLNFWATWCAPCRQELPEFSAFAKDHPEVEVVAVSMDDLSTAELAPLARRFGITWTVGVADAAMRRDWNISTLPTTVVVGPDGRIWNSHVGAMTRQDLARAIRAPDSGS